MSIEEQLAEAKEALDVARRHASVQIDRIAEIQKALAAQVDHAQWQSQDINTMRHALEKIRDEDYRGNHHESHFIATRALEEIE